MRFFVMLSGGIIRVSALNASDVEQGIAADLKELAFSHIREKPTIWQSAHGRGISHRRTPYKGDESSVREESYGSRISKRFLP
jgi:hypothetical protein